MSLPLSLIHRAGRIGEAIGSGQYQSARADGVQISGYGVDFNDSWEATRRTTLLMSSLVRQSAHAPAIRQAASDILSQAFSHEPLAILESAHRWIQNRVRFVEPPELIDQGEFGRQLLIMPTVLLANSDARGACGDFSMLAAALLAEIGFTQMRWRTVALDERVPSRLGHVYLVVKINGQWVPFDSSHGPYVGWEVGGILRKEEFNV